ncbi:MAG: tetratricopeptide repeat protein [Planctomycetota bacterium]|nr:tetratricopeptide repeat protein [Planctomycetota bacterium]
MHCLVSVSLAWLLQAGLCHAGVTSFPRQENPSLNRTLVTDGYVDDARCARCHEEIAETYSHLGMGRSFHVPGPDNAVGDFSPEGGRFHHEASGMHYRMWHDASGRMWMRQHELDADGNEINAIDVEAHFGVGSGNHARTYLHRSPSGELWELPVSWYTKGGWNMSPGFDHADHQRLGRQVTRECMFCHNAYPSVPVGSDMLGQPDAFPVELPNGIGCQRCHGPGKAHVDLAYSADATDEEIRNSILDPTDLSPALAEDVCLQCHMQPTSRLGSLVRPYPRGDFSYRPGEPLGDYLVHIDYELPQDHPVFEVNHHAYRLQASPCWQGPGSPGCLDCHDPHRKLTPAELVERTRTSCLSCHGPADCHVEQVMQVPIAEAQDCARCHMPSRFTSDAIHVEVTDHLIQNPLPASERGAPAYDIPPPASFTARVLQPERHGDAELMRRWELDGELIGDKTESINELASLTVDDPTPLDLVLLAQAYLHEQQVDQARSTLERLAAANPGMPLAQKNLAMLDLQDGQFNAAEQRMKQLTQANPDDAAAWRHLATSLQAQSRHPEAIEACREVVRLRPLDQGALSQLGLLLAANGQFDEAVDVLERAEALAPGNPAIAYNHGLAAWKIGARPRAQQAWNHALQRSPAAPRLLQATAITSSLPWDDLELNPQQGLSHAKMLVELQPQSPDATVVLAAAQLAAGNLQETANSLNLAVERQADLASIRLIQAMLLAEAGQREEGEAIYRKVLPRIQQRNMLREGLLNRAVIIFK